MNIAVVYAGDARDPDAWSGIPSSLLLGFEQLGVSTHTIDSSIPPRVGSILRRARLPHPELCRIQTLVARRRLKRHRFDAIVQIGTDFTITTSIPTATYEDMTVVQHERLGDVWFMGYGTRARYAWRKRQRTAYTNAAVCCTMTNWAARSVIDDYGIEPSKVIAVGLGGNHLVQPPAQRDWSRPRFLVLARDWQRKNVPLIVETFSRVREFHPDSTLDVVGPFSSPDVPGATLHGPLSLRSESDRRSAESLFSRATCYVMPSTHEAAGQVFVEAAHCGVPSIGPSVGGAAEIIGDGGVVVDPAAPDQLYDAMLKLCDPVVARGLGERAQRNSARWTWPHTARRILSALGIPLSVS